MKIGFGIPVSGSWATPDVIAHMVRQAEDLGYHSVWTFQRLLSESSAPVYRSVLDPLTTLAYAAAVTSRIRLGVAVVNLPFISPALLAKQAATIDILSGGRLDLGLGLGWSDAEFAASGATKHGVGRRAEEYVRLIRALWTDEVIDHHGEFYQVLAGRQEPKPVQRPHPPILLGGMAPGALRRAGRIADGWISSSRADLRSVGDAVAVIRDAAAEAGRDPDALRFICRGVVRLQITQEHRAPLTGSADQIRADIADLEAKGITEVFADLNFDPRIGSPDVDSVTACRLAEATLAAFKPPS